MSDYTTFGAGLSSDMAQYGNSPGGGASQSSAAGAVADVPAAPANTPQAQQSAFGSGLSNFLPPSYKPPAQGADPLDASAELLQQRIARAGSIASNPVASFLDPEGAAAARAAVPAMTEQLQKIKEQKQRAVDIKQTAQNWGLANPTQFGSAATDTTLANEALRQWKDEGNFNAYKALSGLSPEWKNRADLYMPDAMNKFASHVEGVQKGITALNGGAGMNSEAAYQAARKQVIEGNDLGSIGIKPEDIPATRGEWMAKRGALEAQYNMAQRTVNAFRTRQDQLNQAVPVTDEKVAGQIQGTYQFGNGEAVPGFKAVSLPGYGDVQGVMGPPGSRDTANRGVTWSNAAPEQIKTVQEQLKAPEVQGAISKYKMARDFAATANNDKLYKSAAGLSLISDELGAIGRDVAEGSKAAGSIGLTKMLEAKYGTIDNARNALERERSALKEWLSKGGANNPRLSPPSIQGIKDVANFKRDQAVSEVKQRIGQPLETAGRYGMLLKNMGLDAELTDDPALRGTYDAALKQGNREIDSYPMVTVGDRRVMLPTGSNVPGAKVAPLDHGTTNPGGAGGGTPQGTPPAAPQAPVTTAGQPQGPAGGAAITIAGQNVNMPLPPGASPAYPAKMQRIESGNERDPWKAGTSASSAGGAFQMIDSTWKQNRPPGAPDRARDATPQQQADATANLTAKNAASLKSAGLPVNDTTLYMAHNVGAGGASALLSASPTQDARTVVGEKAAANNPLFFKGRPTVATVLQRYQDEMDRAPDDRSRVRGAAAEAPTSMWSRVGNLLLMPPEARAAAAGGMTPEEAQAFGKVATEHAPAIGSTVGAVIGSAGGPVGTVGGGAIGGGAGQAFKDWAQGNEQSPAAIAKQTALGGVLGIAPEGRPLLGAAARVLGVGGADAGLTAAQGGDAYDIASSAAEGGAYALGGEALGRFISSLGPAAHKVLSNYLPSAQKEISAQAGKLAEARKVLETEQPKLPGEGAGANPKYEAAKKAEADATQAIKDHGQNPDDMVYAYEQTKAGTSAGEAAVLRKANTEKATVSEGYSGLRTQMRETGVGAPKPNQIVPDGPIAQLRTAENPTGGVPEQFRPEAEHAERLIKAPAQNWGEKWQQLQNAGSELIQKRMSFLANNDKPSAEAMDEIFQGVRNQQKAAAEYVFGADKGKQVISTLENLDKRYAKVMNATQGLNYEKMRGILAQGNTPAARELSKNFTEFAKGDTSALRAFNAMKAGARGDWKSEAALMGPVIAGEVAANLHGVPTIGAVSALIGGHRLYKMVQGYMNAKILGKTVTFKDFLAQEVKSGISKLAGTAAQRGATMQ